MKSSSIITRVVVSFVIAVILGAGISNFLNVNLHVKQYEEQVHRLNSQQLDVASKDLQGYIKEYEVIVNAMALNAAHRLEFAGNSLDMNDEEVFYTQMFTDYLLGEQAISDSVYIYFNPEIDGDVHDVWMHKQNDVTVVRELEVPLSRYENKDNMDWFYGPMSGGQGRWLEPYYNRFNQYVVSYVAPIYVHDEFMGIIGVYLSIKDIVSLLDADLLGNGDMLALYNGDDKVISHPIFKEGTPRKSVVHDVKEQVIDDSTQSLKSELIKVNMGGKRFFQYQNRLSNNWLLVYSVPEGIVYDKVAKTIQLSLLVVLVTLLIIMIPVFIYARKYRKISTHIIDILNQVKRGNLTKRIDIDSDNEIGIMVKAIDESNEGLLRNINEKNKLAFYNSITDVPNRTSLSSNLKSMMNQKRQENLVLIYVDIDNFRNINELIGYDQGNRLINRVADILLSFEDLGIELYHTNINEFVYLINRDFDDEDLGYFTKQILSKFGKNYTLNYQSFYMTVSIGMARYNDKIKTPSDFYRIADLATYEAKKLGRNNWVNYNESMYDRLIQFNTLEKDFDKALKNSEFVVYYQPQISCNNERVTSLEALVRWQHPEKGLLFPDYFIDYAEKSGLISRMGDFVLRDTCRQVIKLQEKGYDLKVAVNISRRQIMENDFVVRSLAIIDQEGVAPSDLEFEITESLIEIDKENMISKLNQLRDYGITISLDDFGTGFASFNSLNDLPISILKLDKSLINDVLTSTNQLIMTESIIDLAHKLKMEVIAEGVEHKEQVDILKNVGCDMIQGYYYAKPLEEKKLTEFISKHN